MLTGKHEKTLWALAATKKNITCHRAIIYEFDQHGKLIREETYFDKTAPLASVGIIRDTRTKLGIFLLILPQSPILALRSALKTLFGKKKTRQAVRLVRH